jgi:type IX secretion system PorP/SprF family membrane protein
MKNIFFLIIFVFLMMHSKAQDGQLSYVYASPMTVNPASTGNISEGKWRLNTTFRKQWSSFIDKGIVNYALSFDMPFTSKKVALGGQFYNNSAAGGAMKNITGAISFSYNTYLSHSSKTKLAFGLQAGFGQKHFDPTQLTFDNQYVPGLGFDPTMDNREHFTQTSVFYPDFAFGMLLFKEPTGNKKFYPWIGLSAYHLTQPNEAFYESVDSKLQRKYIVNVGAIIRTSETFTIVPHVLLATQASVVQLNLGGTFNVDFNSFTTLMFGGYLRNKDAGIAMLGIDYDRYTIQFVYDINTSSLNTVTRGFGGYEISFRYLMTSDRRYRNSFF